MNTIEAALNDPAASDWFKHALRTALGRDPVDCVNDCAYLLSLLKIRAAAVEAKAKEYADTLMRGHCVHCGQLALLELGLCGPCKSGLRESFKR